MKTGFTLIELLLALSFSSIILSILFTSFFQINRTAIIAEDLIEMDSRQQTFAHFFQRDITGAFVPVQAIEVEKKEEKSKDEAAAKAQKAEAVRTPIVKKKEEKPVKLVNDIFYSINKGDMLNELTFITNNPVRVYAYANNTEVKPKVVRVVYRLEPDKGKKGSYKLMRQEDTQLDFANYKKNATKPIKAYEMINNIKSLKVEFQAPQPPKEESKDKKSEKKEPIIFETKKEWHSDEIRKAQKKQSQIPQFVTVTLSLWDNQQEQDHTLTLNYQIPAFGSDLITTKTQEPPKKVAPQDTKNQKSPSTLKTAQAGRTRMLPNVQELRTSLHDYLNLMQGK